ncbi:hypothetical protein CO683_03865 [Bradyrhizobium ottawaense]|uniref:hypothetical protein n=1 Tax=Bradyrhizobium ottawaense TaxID=931866 RepID=UPI000BEAA259|nr:hypothetical protein [Bradyrhizobium ottawaense]PDT72268.1 hypothetical protein CO683_03865 [Bradyrhizobium ottawaense]
MRRRIKQSISFNQRLADEAASFRKAEELPPGTARKLLMKRVRQAEANCRHAQRSAIFSAWAAESKIDADRRAITALTLQDSA